MVLGVLPSAIAEHNAIGAKVTAGNPDPVPSEEPDIPDAMRPIYHGGGAPAPTVVDPVAYHGTYPRVSPEDQSGLGMGEWVGYINGVIEYGPNPFVAGAFDQDNDPLYRVFPGDDAYCQSVDGKADTGADPADPSDDPCAGTGHGVSVDLPTNHHLQQHHIDVVHPDREGSGFIYPGLYDFYVYIFGEGSSDVRPGSGAFDYLDESLCEDHLASLNIENNLGDCTLITPTDLQNHVSSTLTDANGATQEAAFCVFAPRFYQVGGSDEPPTCQNRMEDYVEHTGAPTYLSNKPGWYGGNFFIDHIGSTVAAEEVVLKGGSRSDISAGGMFHYYVNPVRPVAELRCASPPISTTAPDSLDTGITFDEASGTWAGDGAFDYLVEAHDVDVYTAIDSNAERQFVVDTVNEVLDQVPGLPPEVGQLIDDAIDAAEALLETTDPIADAADELSGRAFPYTLNRGEPNSADDSSHLYTRDATVDIGVCDGGLNDPDKVDGLSTVYSNYIQADYTTGQIFNGLVLHDYTELDGEGLPRDSNEQGWNPWNPNTYTFDGEILGFLDHNPNGQLDACPSGGNQIGAGQDLCVAQIRWDVNNPDSEIQEAKTETWAPANGFDDFTGLYFTLKLTGPVATYDLENTPDQNAQVFFDRTRLLASEGQNCIVGISKGLLDDPANDARFRELIGAASGEQTATDGPITDKLCEGADGDVAFIRDAFADQDSAGDFDAAFEWVKLSATPEATHPDTGDGLTFNAVITVAETGDTLTAGNLELSAATDGTPTLEKIWTDEDGDKTFVWTDHDAFESTPDNAE